MESQSHLDMSLGLWDLECSGKARFFFVVVRGRSLLGSVAEASFDVLGRRVLLYFC
jgi:hypothetical protein